MNLKEGMIVEIDGEKYFVLETSGGYYKSSASNPNLGGYYPPNKIVLRKVVDYE